MKFKQRSEEQPPLPQSPADYGISEEERIKRKITFLESMRSIWEKFRDTTDDFERKVKLQKKVEEYSQQIAKWEKRYANLKFPKPKRWPPKCPRCGVHHWREEPCSDWNL